MTYEVFALGNPLMDVIVEVDDEILNGFNFEKGRMRLIDKRQAIELNEQLIDLDKKVAPGGSAANVAAGITAFGGRAFFQGMIGEDENGKAYEKLMNDSGVDTNLPTNIVPTGYATTFITPDYERTFATFLGAATKFDKDDLDIENLKKAKILHIEGFQLQTENQRETVMEAVRIAKENGVKISLDLADSLFVEDSLEQVRDFVENVDIIFANEREAEAFNKGKDEDYIFKAAETVAVTHGKKGSVISHKGKKHKIEAFKIKEVNTNGAGDMYNAGVLYGIANGMTMDAAGKIASYAAAQVVGEREARLGRALIEEINEMVL